MTATLDLDLAGDLTDASGGFRLAVRHTAALDGITVLFGPSGSGKTTLLRAIAGLETRIAGRIAFDGEVWQDESRALPAWRRGAGLVFQDARLFAHLDVAGNLRFAAKRAPEAGDGVPAIAWEEVVQTLDLGPLLARRADTLSGGERQRVAIGRTLLARPRLLLMDEPLAALDAARKADILPYIERLPGAFGVPIVYVTHAIEEVAQLARAMVAMADGAVVAAGPVAEVVERIDLQPLTGRFEAGVVLDARVAGHDKAWALTTLDLGGQALAMPALDLPVGADVRIRIRARDVSLAMRRPEAISVRNILEGTVTEVREEPATAFAEVLVTLDGGAGAGSGGAHLRARITRQSAAELALAPGARVYALVKSIAFDRRAMGNV